MEKLVFATDFSCLIIPVIFCIALFIGVCGQSPLFRTSTFYKPFPYNFTRSTGAAGALYHCVFNAGQSVSSRNGIECRQ
ncbi:hypothetical protein [uncultured Bacteroides sp.]|uniref:hypothetical protein n=1 Tax=uncultured Bacteroides sp. TaxID=162156 RepID=UPI00280BCFC3|nr:hypothetical protein [uncultured Bacteroides sp.]